jgi:hypothetical protein
VGNLGAAIGKLEAAKDMVFTGDLHTGKDEAKIKRKAIQKRVDAAMDIVQVRSSCRVYTNIGLYILPSSPAGAK